jgi:hypothetical protein
MTVAFLTVTATMIGINLLGMYDVRRFLAHYDSITDASLPAFKGVARRNMLMALVSIPLAVVLLGLGIYLVTVRELEGLAITLGAGAALIIVGLVGKPSADRTRALPCEPELNGEYERICTTWKKSVLPNF